MNNVSLVVMEKGSDWPGHVDGLEDVIAFSHNDLELGRRMRERLDALRAAGRSVRLAVLACSDSSGHVSTLGRAGIARDLLAAVRQASFGRLVLTASESASSSLRVELFRLTDELTAELGRASVDIVLQFRPTRRSGGVGSTSSRQSERRDRWEPAFSSR